MSVVLSLGIPLYIYRSQSIQLYIYRSQYIELYIYRSQYIKFYIYRSQSIQLYISIEANLSSSTSIEANPFRSYSFCELALSLFLCVCMVSVVLHLLSLIKVRYHFISFINIALHIDITTSISPSPPTAPLFFSQRLLLAFMAFLGNVFIYTTRVNLSVAVVCMIRDSVSNTTVSSIADNNNSLFNTTVAPSGGHGSSCGGATDSGKDTVYEVSGIIENEKYIFVAPCINLITFIFKN